MKRYQGHEFRVAVETACHKICASLSLKPVWIEWSAYATTAAISADGAILLPDVADDALISAAVLERYTGFVVHELLHRRYTKFAWFGSTNPYLRQLHNAVEDIWIERTGISKCLTGNIEGLLTSLVNGIVAEAVDQVSDWTDPAQYPFVLAVEGRRYANKVPVATGLQPIFDEASTRIDSCHSTRDTFAVAKWVFDQLKSLDEPKPKQSEQSKPKQSKPQQGDQQADQQQGKPQQGTQEPQQGGQSGESIGDQPQPGKARPVSEDSLAVEVEPQLDAPKGAAGIGNYNRGADMADPRKHVKDFSHAILPVVGGKLRYNIKRLFDNSGREDYQSNRKQGSINSRSLVKTATGSDRVFKRRLEIAGIDSAVVILIDVSSSMDHDNRIVFARSTCSALVDALGAAGVATSIVTFSSKTSVLSPFGTSPRAAKELVSRVETYSTTNDYHAIRVAHEMLLARPEQRKIVISLTDGMGDIESSREQIASGVRSGVTTIGIGIGKDVSKVYDNNVLVRKMQDLGNATFNKIRVAL